MPALDFILSPPNLAVVSPDGMAENPIDPNLVGAGAKPFDDLMTQALSPAAAEADAGNRQPVDPTHPAPARPAPHPVASAQQPTPAPNGAARNLKSAEENAAQTDASTADKASKKSAGKPDKNEVAANGTPARNEVSPSANLPAVALPQISALPFAGFPVLPPAGNKAGQAGGTTLPHPVPAIEAAGSPIPASGNNSVAQAGVSTLKAASAPKDSARPANSSLAASLKPNDGTDAANPKPARPIADAPTTPKLVAEAAAEPLRSTPIPEKPAVPQPASATPPAVPPETGGIAAAKLDIAMKKTEKVNKVAGSAEKVLPDNAVSRTRENNLPTADNVARTSPRNGQAEIIIGPSLKESPAPVASAGTAAASPVVNLGSRALDRTHDMVALQATRLVDAKLDSLHVVIKPGAGTQLSLELRQRDDGVEAQAVLQRGDFAQLNQHWPELQQRLEQRGIRLAPLGGGEDFNFSNNQQDFQQSQRESTGPDPLVASAFAEFALAGPAVSRSTAAATPGLAGRGWESWA